MFAIIFIFILVAILIYFVSKEIRLESIRIGANKEILKIEISRPQGNVVNAIKSVWRNDNFLLDFKDILNELSIDEKSIKNLIVFKYRDSSNIENKHWKLINSEDFVYSKIIDQVICKVSLTSSFNQIKKEYCLLDDDLKYFCKLLVMYMTLSDFFLIAQRWIFKTVIMTIDDVEPDICASLFLEK
jgi:hypothetical protein